MFNRTDAKRLGTRIGATVVFHRQELARTGASYVQHTIRGSAMNVVDEIAAKYAKRIEAKRGELMGVEYRLEVWLLTREEIDAMFAEAYNAGANDGARWGLSAVQP